jgi:hypothetical protein
VHNGILAQETETVWCFGKCGFSVAILASSVSTNGIVAILSTKFVLRAGPQP